MKKAKTEKLSWRLSETKCRYAIGYVPTNGQAAWNKASKNLLKLSTVSSTGIHALGDGSSVCPVMDKSSPSLKKESNGKFIYVLKRV